MSSKTKPFHQPGDHRFRHADPRHDRRAGPAHRRAPTPGEYTLGHAGRQVRVGPVAFWTIVGTLVVMATWSVVTATYFAFRDDLLTRLIARQTDMQYAYEDRIAELRAQVDRLASRQLLDQEQYEQKLDQLVRRQSTLETRANALNGVPDPTPTGSTRTHGRPAINTDRAAQPTIKASPINDTVILVAPPDREARLESRALPSTGTRVAVKGNAAGIEASLMRLQASLDRVESIQISTLNSLEEGYDAKARRIRGVLVDLGLDMEKLPAARPLGPAVGGPYVPAGKASDANPFERQLFRINSARSQLDRFTRALVAVPVRKPITGEIDTSSGFGVRMDPFLRSPAMHTGLDFRAEFGEPIHATAAGTVTHAGWQGGYGKMVEVNHGNGFATRYGHMSLINVEVGDTVKIGQIVGKVGSTGRSTGPHLHYETRIDNEAVDPQKFLRAGIRLGTM